MVAVDDAGAIRDGFAGLRPDRELLPLADAAKCRSEADWLVGINGTRAMTAFNNKVSESGFYKTTVGRVQTPTLTILVEREERIQNFKSRDYWEACPIRRQSGRVRRALVRSAVQEGRRRRAQARAVVGWGRGGGHRCRLQRQDCQRETKQPRSSRRCCST